MDFIDSVGTTGHPSMIVLAQFARRLCSPTMVQDLIVTGNSTDLQLYSQCRTMGSIHTDIMTLACDDDGCSQCHSRWISICPKEYVVLIIWTSKPTMSAVTMMGIVCNAAHTFWSIWAKSNVNCGVYLWIGQSGTSWFLSKTSEQQLQFNPVENSCMLNTLRQIAMLDC